MAARRRKAVVGPRVATRWIGDAFVLDGDLSRGAPAVFVGADAHGQRAPRCARVRIIEVIRDFEFGVDELLLYFAAGTVRGECVLPRLASYRDEDVLALVDEDVADVTLARLLERVTRSNAGAFDAPSRVGLALYVARACVRAWQAASLAERVVVEMQPKRIALAWDGGVHCHVSPAPSEDAWEWSDDPVDAVAFEVGFGREEQTLGALLYTIIAGEHPFALPESDDDVDGPLDDDEDDFADEDEAAADEYARARELADRRDSNEHVPLRDAADVSASVHALVESMLAPQRRRSWDQLATALDEELAREPFDARALAGMLDAMFPDEKRAALLEREDRLGVLPGPNVMQAEWSLLDDDAALEDDDGGNLSGLWHEPEREPHVEPVDPFDDER